MLSLELTENYCAEMATEWVVLNDALCFHLVDFPGCTILEVFAKPKVVIFPSKTGKTLIGQVTCPICGTAYEEASKVLTREANRRKREK
jgi:hypothetical protein